MNSLVARPSSEVRITGTSFLLPGSRAWKSWAPQYSLDFGEYGDWPNVLTDPDEQRAVVFVLLFDDLTADGHAGPDGSAGVSESVLSALRARLANTPAKPTIVAWASADPGTVLSGGKQRLASRVIGQHFEAALYELAAEHPGLYVLCLDEVIAELGRGRAFDSRNFYAVHCRLSIEGVEHVARAARDMLDRTVQAPRKVLVVDCDNTLWGGVVGEDGLVGLQLGQDGLGAAFVDFQRVIRRLSTQGVLIAIASKNNEEEVWEVFDRHRGMVLSRQHITGWRIDWQEKADNIGAIAEELGLGLDSFVFWDDNPLERTAVREALPQVYVPEIPEQVTEWPRALNRVIEFARFEATAEDQRKAEQYRARAEFVQQVSRETDKRAFLRSIALRPEAVPIDQSTVARAAQLCAKTNQFNLRTVRHTTPALLALEAEQRGARFLVRLADRFGDHGIVGLLVARVAPGNPEVAFLDTLLMSCRVLGRHLEGWMLDRCIDTLRQQGVKFLVGEYVPTGRNRMVGSLLNEIGFVPAATLAAPAQGPIIGAVRDWLNDGELFVADCAAIRIPGLEVYERDAIAA